MDYLTNDTDIKKVADAIRAKGGTSAPLAYPSGFVSAIQAIPSGSAKEEQEKTVTITANGTVEITPDAGKTLSRATAIVNVPTSGGSDVLNSFLERTITGEYTNNEITMLGSYALEGCDLTSVNFPAVTSVGAYTFRMCPALNSVNLLVATTIATGCFYGCTALSSIKLPVAETVQATTYYNCKALERVDFPVVTSIDNTAFARCSALTCAIFRNTTKVVSLGSTNAFTKTPIASGTGYIYVPSTLVAAYKNATNWATYANQIRAIEDYPSITGG